MNISVVNAALCKGIEAFEVKVEVELSDGIGIHLVGLADAALKETLLRTVTALQSLGFHLPGKKIIINLAPADLHKRGSGFDLPIAVGFIAASGQRELPLAPHFLVVGELGLDGRLRPVPGAVSMARLAADKGYKGIILPVDSAVEAADFHDIDVYGVDSLGDVLRILEGKDDCRELLVWNRFNSDDNTPFSAPDTVDFRDIEGKDAEKRALEIAAAGGHNLLMVGAPGSGKSCLAKALAGILPRMTFDEALETSRIYSATGRLSGNYGLLLHRPFRAPHCSSSLSAMLGGGTDLAPGEVSLADNGVLFLDDVSVMPKSVIEALRGPIEDKKVTLARLREKVEYPSSFLLVAALNPCPCGYWGVGDRCTCTPSQRKSYMDRISGTLTNHLDIQLSVSPTPQTPATPGSTKESSRDVRKRVAKAREIQQRRFADEAIKTNGEMTSSLVNKYCRLSQECAGFVEKTFDSLLLSSQSYVNILKVARTIADLDGFEEILPAHLAEAAGLRALDKELHVLR